MIEAILPAEAATAEAFDDPPGLTLFPEEEAVIARAVGKRRREFTTTRACARTALARLGLPPVPIVPGPRGAPQWPVGVVGSMTHCAGYRACAVARDLDLLTIGLDAEPHGQLPEGVLDAVSRPEEREQLAALAATVPGTHWDRMLFSAKESVYKAWFPLTQRWLGFAGRVAHHRSGPRDVHRPVAGRRAQARGWAAHRLHRALAGRGRPGRHGYRRASYVVTGAPPGT